jgi:hypothetical protein
MDIRKLEDLLKKVKSGKITLDEALAELKSLPFEDLGFTRIDHHRSLRKGFPEVIWGEGKSSGQILSIIKQLKRKGQNILITRLEVKKAKAVRKVRIQGSDPSHPFRQIWREGNDPGYHCRDNRHPCGGRSFGHGSIHGKSCGGHL